MVRYMGNTASFEIEKEDKNGFQQVPEGKLSITYMSYV